MLNTSLKFTYDVFKISIETPSWQDFGASVNFIFFEMFGGKAFFIKFHSAVKYGV